MLSDANFADTYAAMGKGERDAGILLGGGLILWFAWLCGTAIGAVGGAALGDVNAYGIDVLMPVYFGAVVVAGLTTPGSWSPAAVAAVVALATIPVLPAGWNVIAAALAGGAVGAWRATR